MLISYTLPTRENLESESEFILGRINLELMLHGTPDKKWCYVIRINYSLLKGLCDDGAFNATQ